jgi:DNA replication protein DnaC
MNDALQNLLKQLRLSGLLSTLEVRLHEAAANQLSQRDFLELILQDELAVRNDRLIGRRVKVAQFREVKPLDQFDWSFNPTIPKKPIFELATCNFLRQRRDVLFLGPPGVGKSFLAQALGYQAIKAGFLVLYRSVFDLVRDFLHDELLGEGDKMLAKYLKPDLLIIDDMGMKQLPKRSGECLFEIILRRYETRSTIMTSNRPLEDWGKLLGDVPSATAILDRFLHHAELIELKGKSYRLNHRFAVNNATESEPEEAKSRGKPATQEEAPQGSKPASARGAPQGSKPASARGAPHGSAGKDKKA